ncbi:unnamed protein product [Orchesella dallaii]|uniref:Uncharacterized protein n=1 Tax=Orchesella dallaii TaxID=48710 RepID=A0ABP1S8R0_9HEXA
MQSSCTTVVKDGVVTVSEIPSHDEEGKEKVKNHAGEQENRGHGKNNKDTDGVKANLEPVPPVLLSPTSPLSTPLPAVVLSPIRPPLPLVPLTIKKSVASKSSLAPKKQMRQTVDDSEGIEAMSFTEGGNKGSGKTDVDQTKKAKAVGLPRTSTHASTKSTPPSTVKGSSAASPKTPKAPITRAKPDDNATPSTSTAAASSAGSASVDKVGSLSRKRKGGKVGSKRKRSRFSESELKMRGSKSKGKKQSAIKPKILDAPKTKPAVSEKLIEKYLCPYCEIFDSPDLEDINEHQRICTKRKRSQKQHERDKKKDIKDEERKKGSEVFC